MSLMENFQISTVHTYLPLKNLKNQIAKLSNYAVKKVPPYFMNEVKSKMRTSEVQHEANGSSGSIQTLPIGLKALFITLWKCT